MTEEPRLALLTLAEYQETLERLQRLERLCVRAADALQDLDRFAFYCWSCRNEKLPELIAELRKAV
jgi:hypothetical protein